MSAAGDRITVAGICAAVAVAANQSQAIFEQLEKYFGSSPYYVFVQEISYELAAAIIALVLLYNAWTPSLSAQYAEIRSNWRLGKIGPVGYALYLDEWAVILTITVVIAAFSYHSFLKAMRGYQSYGLAYVSRRACEGSMAEAVERIKDLSGNHLWDKYRLALAGSRDRYAYLDKIEDQRRNQFNALVGRAPAEELLAEAVELRAIFGVDVRQSIGQAAVIGETGILHDWKAFIELPSCGPGG